MSKIAQNSLPSASNKPYASPKLIKDPSLPTSIPTTSKNGADEDSEKSCRKKFCNYVYDKENKTFCDRTCKNWFLIVGYSTMYLIFLATYALFFLFISLWILRLTSNFQEFEKVDLLTYSGSGIGLTATPTSESSYPLIWYRKGQSQDYEKYIKALDSLLVRKRRKRDLDVLGPCGKSPYGYGDNPCVIVRVNKQFHWAGKPIVENSTEMKIIPAEVRHWVEKDRKLWLHCSGHHAYDNEHIGRVRYFPDPPGFDPGLFPFETESPVIAVQMSNFTMGLSIAVKCQLWYVGGLASVNFMLYVSSDDKVSNRI